MIIQKQIHDQRNWCSSRTNSVRTVFLKEQCHQQLAVHGRRQEKLLQAMKTSHVFLKTITLVPHTYTHHHSWFSVVINICWPRHWHITSPAKRMSQPVGRSFSSQQDTVWYALKIHAACLINNSTDHWSTPKAGRQSFNQQSSVPESEADWYPDGWKMAVLTATASNWAAMPTV